MDTKILSTVPPTITVFLNKVQSLKKGGVKFKSDAFHSPIVRLIAKTRVPRTHEKTDEDRDRDREKEAGERQMGSGTSTVGMEVFGNADGTRYHPHSRRRDASYLARWKLVFFPVCSSNR